MDVELLSYTKDADRLCATIARTCYSEDDAGYLLEQGKDYSKVLKSVLKSGHHSVIEHAVFTFNISNLSRVTSHQLVRHRIGSYTQRSARYVKHSAMNTTLPDSITEDEETRDMVYKLEDTIDEVAQTLRDKGIPEEDIRYIYPNSLSTNIVVTMNARSLWNFFSLRCCTRSQDEIRSLANKMLALCKNVAPIIFENAGKPCLRGHCPEGNMSCRVIEAKRKREDVEHFKAENVECYRVGDVWVTIGTPVPSELAQFVIGWNGLVYNMSFESIVTENRRIEDLKRGDSPLDWYTEHGTTVREEMLKKKVRSIGEKR